MNPSESDDDLDTILLHGVSLPEPAESVEAETSSTSELAPEPLILRAFDDSVPGRDFQPRLLRFGEAA